MSYRNRHKRLKNKRKIDSESNELTTTWFHLLPCDVIELIFSKLNWVDRIRSQAVSKKSLQLLPEIPAKPIDVTFPWMATHYYPTRQLVWSFSRLYFLTVAEPIKPYHPDTSDELPKKKPEASQVLVKTREAAKDFCDPREWNVCASRCGWILFSKPEFNRVMVCIAFSFVVYCPYSKDIIHLARLEKRNCSKATFSSDPTSPGCVFFAHSCHSRTIHHISICRVRDRHWTELEFDHDGAEDLRGVKDVTYENGLFYCVFARGQLGAFDVARKEWKLLSSFPQFSKTSNLYLVASNKELLVACSMSYCEDRWQLWKLGISEKRWVRKESLGDRVLFVGYTSYCIEAVGELSMYANKLFCVCNNLTPHCFSFSTGKGESQSIFARDYDSRKTRFWIDPPRLMTRIGVGHINLP